MGFLIDPNIVLSLPFFFAAATSELYQRKDNVSTGPKMTIWAKKHGIISERFTVPYCAIYGQ